MFVDKITEDASIFLGIETEESLNEGFIRDIMEGVFDFLQSFLSDAKAEIDETREYLTKNSINDKKFIEKNRDTILDAYRNLKTDINIGKGYYNFKDSLIEPKTVEISVNLDELMKRLNSKEDKDKFLGMVYDRLIKGSNPNNYKKLYFDQQATYCRGRMPKKEIDIKMAVQILGNRSSLEKQLNEIYKKSIKVYKEWEANAKKIELKDKYTKEQLKLYSKLCQDILYLCKQTYQMDLKLLKTQYQQYKTICKVLCGFKDYDTVVVQQPVPMPMYM